MNDVSLIASVAVAIVFGIAGTGKTRIAGQRWRNINLLVIALIGVITALRAPLPITTPVFDYGAGILLGVITVGSPWLIDLVSRSTLDRTDELAT